MLPTVRHFVSLATLGVALPMLAAPALAGGGPGCQHGMGHHGGMARLTVTGTGESRVPPDMAMVTLGVTTQAPGATEAMAGNAERQGKVIEALKGAGIAPEDIQTAGLSLSPLTDYQDGKAPVVTGYQAQNLVNVRVLDLGGLGQVLDALVAAGANEIQGIGFARRDDQAAADEARGRAVAEAQRRAGVLAGAAGMTLGPVLAIRDGGQPGGPMPMAMRQMDAKTASSVPIETGEIGLSAMVEMDFALLPAGGGEAPACGMGPMHHQPGMARGKGGHPGMGDHMGGGRIPAPPIGN